MRSLSLPGARGALGTDRLAKIALQDSALFAYRAQYWRQTQALIDGLQAAHFGHALVALYAPFAQRE